MVASAQSTLAKVGPGKHRGIEKTGEVATAMRPVIDSSFGASIALTFEFWDGSKLSPRDPSLATLRFNSPDAITRLLWMPNELGLCRAYVAGDVEVDGNLYDVLTAFRDSKPAIAEVRHAWRVVPTAVVAAKRVGALGKPLPPPPEEARLNGLRHGLRHSLRRDATAIGHHYDVGNDFYRLVLGETMTYSCARFVTAEATLEAAQTAKHDLICHKLGLPAHPGARLLDVGCGWGSMAIHAATKYDARVVGITISQAQAELARQRVAEAGVTDRVEIRLQDYRDLSGEQFDAISSVGMSEHVGHAKLSTYLETLRSVLVPQGRLLNHAISSVGGSTLGSRSFIGRYVFPDGELVDVGKVVLAMEEAGFEVRDVESLREHYARTLRCWVSNLESHWDEAVKLVGEPRAKIWRLYMTGSAVGFEDGGIAIHQVLGVIPTGSGTSGMPATRRDWP
ncbi:MAG TPA: cyclopropane-fatty-acyl-phospholipid synthase family protein [Ilumatobacteraceae bacterium]|nr:cyclopropane-fatty-acyl-phospholipid synthase family protein [Ilumatobacteraceae bacterium]